VILHRLRLTNFRGIADREIAFPDHGVVVVCGPNEVGKSSMLEALDLLLEYKDRSLNQKVKQVKQVHADVGAEVEAEITTGPYRFVYRKRFHKKFLTELTVIEPARSQHSGDEAHEKVQAMLAETVDTRLWEAQRVLQSAAAAPVDLSGCDALSRALDAAAGEVTAASGGESLLIDRIDTEYERYFTPAAGKPTKEFKDAISRVRAAEQQAQTCLAAVADVEERVRRHEELTSCSQELAAALEPATARLAAAQKAHAVVTELSEQLGQAKLVATAAAATSANSALGNGQRQRLVADAERRAATMTGLQTGLAAAEVAEAQSRNAAQAATATAEQAAAALAAAQDRLEAARVTAEACVAREEADRLAARLQRIDETEANLAHVAGQVAAVALTDEVLADVERTSALVQRLEAQLQADVSIVEITATADLDISVDGDPRALSAGQSWAQPASTAVTVDLPGVLSVRIVPGASAVKLHADLQAAQQDLAEALAKAAVADIAAARELDRHRRELVTTSGQLTAALAVLCDGGDVQRLRARSMELQATVAGASGPVVDAVVAAAELAAANRDLKDVRADADAPRKLAVAATAALAEKSTQTALLRDRENTASAELAAVLDQLITLRAAVADEAVAAQAAADAEMLRRADAEVAALAERYAAADPGAVAAELAAAAEWAEGIARDHDATKQALNDLTVELGVIGSEGRQGQLDEAEAELRRARDEHDRFGGRAAAVRMLRDTMGRHRDSTRQRYVQPYRGELERLGAIVFGPSFEVEVDTDLNIRARTLSGRTVPYESLSGGAREQLGILARLAGAALVAKEDTVPVVIDDALGFSDPERLAKMGAVFNSVGDRGQVIVLTCQPSRYEGVTDARVIELSA